MVKWIYNINTIIISQKSKELRYNYFHDYIDNFIRWNHTKTWRCWTFRTEWGNKRRNRGRIVWRSINYKTSSQCERWCDTITLWRIRNITKTWPIWQPRYYTINRLRDLICSSSLRRRNCYRSWSCNRRWIIWLIWDDNWSNYVPLWRWRDSNSNHSSSFWCCRNHTGYWIRRYIR